MVLWCELCYCTLTRVVLPRVVCCCVLCCPALSHVVIARGGLCCFHVLLPVCRTNQHRPICLRVCPKVGSVLFTCLPACWGGTVVLTWSCCVHPPTYWLTELFITFFLFMYFFLTLFSCLNIFQCYLFCLFSSFLFFFIVIVLLLLPVIIILFLFSLSLFKNSFAHRFILRSRVLLVYINSIFVFILL